VVLAEAVVVLVVVTVLLAYQVKETLVEIPLVV
jgi:hypothetical protein